MGSLTSKPKVPAQQVVNVVQPVAVTPAAEVTQPEVNQEEEASQARKTSLLSRDRGRFGTVLTSFRGFLTQKETLPQRKTLLGE